MSGGQLVVLDRLGRDVKRFPLAEGVVTLGSDHTCDIRFMLDTVNPHHATVAVHANQTVVRNVCEGETLVNGRAVSVAALRHGDVISIGGRQLRWDYTDPTARRVQAPQPALYVARRKSRVARRGSGPAPARRDPALRLAIEMSHRASMPANAGGKQVAIVQPQRRDTNDQNDKPPPRTPLQASKRPRASKNDLDVSITDSEAEKAKRKSSARISPKATVTNLQNTTKATLWIESRKSSPRKSVKINTPIQNVINIRRNTASAKKSTPLRLTVLKRAQSAQKMKVTKIEAPLKIDHTKQAAILLMTGHTPKSKLVSQKTPSPKSTTPQSTSLKSVSPKSSASKSPKSASKSVTPKTSKSVTPKSSSSSSKSVTPKSVSPKSTSLRSSGRRSASFVVKKKSPIRKSTPRGRKSKSSLATASPQDRTVTILEITDSDGRNSTLRSTRRSGRKSEESPLLPSPKKSALKNPLAKKSMRKTESIKFDLSNLENYSQEESDVFMVTDTTRQTGGDSASEDDISLHYSESSSVQSPSPRRSIHSRSSKILEKSLGTTMTISPPSRTLTPESPRPRKSLRGSVILQKALDKSDNTLSYSRRTTKSASDVSQSTVASAFRTRTLSPRTPQNDMESYSIVDLVSIDSNESGRSTSVYNSAGSTNDTAFGTPQNNSARTTRSTLNADMLGSSTPYVKGSRSSTPRSQSSPNISSKSNNSTRLSNKSSVSSRKTKSISTPENSTKHVSVNSTRISRASRSRSRINDSDLMLVEADDADDSPRSSKRTSTSSKRSSSAPQSRSRSKDASNTDSPTENQGISTPENRHSPEEASTPVLSIQSLLDSSQSSLPSQSSRIRGRASIKRKTIGVLSGPKTRVSTKSKSMNFSARKTRLRLSNDSYENMNVSNQQDEEIVTPKSAVKLVQEAVKNKHSTAKKPQSKRSIIDDLNESDIVKQLFNSPVKRKLSQSMTEFSRKQLFDDDDVVQIRRPTRNTVALSGRTLDNSLLDHTEAFTPERFVSPISTPSNSPNLTGIKLMFRKKTPENDLRNVRGVKALLRTPRARKSINNDLTDVAGVKAVFAKSPRNRLSDVRVKEVFASSPKNDLRRVSGVKSLFQTQNKRKSPRNSLGDVRGVKKLFGRKSPVNDLRNVSGVKKTMKRNSPKNDLSDVRGVKRMFRRDKERNELNDLSGVEELFNESNHSHRDAESLFDQLIGKPVIKAVYSKTFSSKSAQKKKAPKRKSLHASLDVITNNVEQWLEQELNKRLHKDKQSGAKDKATHNVTRELQKLATATVEGTTPICTSRTRNSTIVRTSLADVSRKQKSASELYSAHTLPIKKRSLVDKSIEKAKVDGIPINLPIKKRAVVHSTPVKGRQVNMTMNASELGRVSPIVAEKTQDLEQESRSILPKEPVHSRPKSRRGTRAPEIIKPSPKSTRGKSRVPTPIKPTPTKEKSSRKSNVSSPAKRKSSSSAKKPSSPVKKPASPANKPASQAKKLASPAKKPASPKLASPPKKSPSPAKKPASPAKKLASPAKKPTSPAKKPASPVVVKPVTPKTTRSRKTVVASPKPETTTKKRGATLVIAKKPPAMSPQPRATRKRKEPDTLPTPKASPKRTRTTRNKDEKVVEKPKTPKTPKNTRAKVLKTTVVISKPSPQIKPRSTRGRAQQSEAQTSIVTKADTKKKPVSKKVESPKKSPVQRKPVKEATIEPAPKSKGRKTAISKDESQNKAEVEKAQPKTKRGRNTTVEEHVVARKTRKTEKLSPVKPEPKTRAKKTDKQEQPAEEKKTRGKRVVQESVEPEPTVRSRRGAKAENTVVETNTRKRKADVVDERPSKVSKSKEVETRGRNKKIESPKTETVIVPKKTAAKLTKEKKQASVDVPKKATRSRKADVTVEAPKEKVSAKKPVRGKNAPAAEPVIEVGKRKRKTAVESTPVVEAPKKARGSKKPSLVASPAKRATRAAPAVAKTTGRTRRR